MNLFIIKGADIAYISCMHLIMAYIFAMFTEHIFANIYKNNSNDTYQLLLEVVIQVMFSSVLSYIGRNFVQTISSPLDGMYNLNHAEIKELNSGAILLMFIIIFQPRLQNKLAKIRNLNLLEYDK